MAAILQTTIFKGIFMNENVWMTIEILLVSLMLTKLEIKQNLVR